MRERDVRELVGPELTLFLIRSEFTNGPHVAKL